MLANSEAPSFVSCMSDYARTNGNVRLYPENL